MTLRNDIAIVGMSCLFPGAAGIDAYWRNILGGVDAVSDPPPEAWDVDVYYDPEFTDPDKVYCKQGGYLGSLASFDPLAHGIPPVNVGGEPDQWLSLQIAHDALADAGALSLPAEVRKRTGIVLGKGTYLNGGNAIAVQRGLIIEQTVDVLRQVHPEHTEEELDAVRQAMRNALPAISAETVGGLIPNVVVGRVANRLDLMGPAYTVDAACASSLLAVQLAQRHLLDGDCDVMLAGGSQVWMPVPTLNVFSQLGALSRRQQIRPFDKDADGTLLGEGIGMIVLKRAADAVRDGDRVYAVIRGVGVASDGRGVSVMAPRVEGEETALRRAYEAAGVEPDTVALIEAHGTATPVGDVVELRALRRVFGDRKGELPHCGIGSVKSMISHTMPAAGVAGIIKTALALHHRVLPPTLHCDEPNPELDLDNSPFYVNTETRPWIHGGPAPRRAGVNAFGFGGINAHVVLEEAPDDGRLDHLPPWDSEVVILEAADAAPLAEMARRLADVIGNEPAFSLTELAAGQAAKLGALEQPVRLAIVATSLADLAGKLTKAADRLEGGTRRIKGLGGIYFEAEPLGRQGTVVAVFPGEGAEYPNMLADLCLPFPEVRRAFDQVDRIYAGHPRGHLSSDWVFPRPSFSDEERRTAAARLVQMDIAVEAVLTANHAVHSLLSRLGVHWDACVGHSTGEFSAAKAAGVLPIDDHERRTQFSEGLYACYAAAADERRDLPRAVLFAVGTDRSRAEEIAREAGGDVVVAMDNCPHQVVIVGERAKEPAVRAILARESLMFEELPYDRAVHTPRFAPFSDSLRTVFESFEVRPPTVPLYSCTTMAPYPSDPDAIRDLLVEHWTSAVEFRRTIEALHDDGARVFVECGPRGNLTAFIDDILRGREFCAVAADLPRRSGITQLNHLVATLAVHDVDVDVPELFASRDVRAVDWTAPPLDEDPAPKRVPVDLSIAWPMLRVDTMGLAPAPRSNGDRIPASANGRDTVSTTALAVAPPVTAPTLVVSAPPPTRDAAVARDAEPQNGMLQAHFERMAQFLAVEGEVMRARLGGLPCAPETVLSETVVPASLAPAAPAPSTEHRTRLVLDASDASLQDHRLGGALAVVPFTMSMAAMADAAAALAPGAVVVGMRRISARRWLVVDAEPLAVEVTAKFVADEEGCRAVGVALFDASAGGTNQVAVLEGVVLLADDYASSPPPSLRVDEMRASRLTPAELYTEVMFHGPRWQAVCAIEATGPQGVRAQMEVLARDHARLDPNVPTALDAVALDGAGQLVGFWTTEHLERGRIVFPYWVESVDLYGPPRPVGERLTAAAAVDVVDAHTVRSDIEVVGADGRVWMQLTGWADRRFDLPAALAPLVVGGDRPLSSAWPAPLGGAAPALLECRHLDTTVTSGQSLWRQIWVNRVLSPRERTAFAESKLPEPRLLERLGARTAAKEAVQDLLRRHHALDVDVTAIEILADDRGRPLVEGQWITSTIPTPVVSLAHADGLAVAVAGFGERIGIDVEPLRPLPESVVTTAFSATELDLFQVLSPESVDEWTMRCWCAKEAVAKALGTGFVRSPAEVRIEQIDVDRERVLVTPTGPATDAPATRLIVHSAIDDGMVVALTTCETDTPRSENPTSENKENDG